MLVVSPEPITVKAPLPLPDQLGPSIASIRPPPSSNTQSTSVSSSRPYCLDIFLFLKQYYRVLHHRLRQAPLLLFFLVPTASRQHREAYRQHRVAQILHRPARHQRRAAQVQYRTVRRPHKTTIRRSQIAQATLIPAAPLPQAMVEAEADEVQVMQVQVVEEL